MKASTVEHRLSQKTYKIRYPQSRTPLPTVSNSSVYLWQKKYRDFRLQGVLDSTLNSKMYETVRNRLTLEEATASVREGGMQGISMKDSDEEDDN